MNDSKAILKHVTFFICYILLFIFVLTMSTHSYEYMLNEVDSEITSWCQLPPEKDNTRREMYLLFIFLFSVAGAIFLRKTNPTRIALMAILFCYATYALLLKDMMCHVF